MREPNIDALFCGNSTEEWLANVRKSGVTEEVIATMLVPLAIEPYLPKVLLASWQQNFSHPNASWHMAWFVRGGLRVSISCAEFKGKRWLHVCASRKDCMPTWPELREIKRQFIGAEREAIQKFPRESEYVNYAVNALHLWSCLDEDVTPDFRVMGMI